MWPQMDRESWVVILILGCLAIASCGDGSGPATPTEPDPDVPGEVPTEDPIDPVPETTTYRFAFSGLDGFDAQVYVGDTRDFRVAPVFSEDGSFLFGGWSSSGDRILVISDLLDGFARIYEADVSTGTLRQIGDDFGDFRAARWSPTEDLIAYVQGKSLYLRRSDGSEVRPLATSLGNDVRAPTWSHDGAYVAIRAFTLDPANPDFSQLQSKLLVFATDGSEVARIERTGSFIGQPMWRPGASQILLSMTDGQFGSDLMLVDVPGLAETPLTNTPWIESDPSWSQDGEAFVFVSNREGTHEVVVVSMATTDTLRFDVEGSASHPTLAPDGDTVAFVSDWSGRTEHYVTSRSNPSALLNVSAGYTSSHTESGLIWARADEIVAW